MATKVRQICLSIRARYGSKVMIVQFLISTAICKISLNIATISNFHVLLATHLNFAKKKKSQSKSSKSDLPR